MPMTIEMERELRHTWIKLEIEELYEENYQMRMLASNTIPGLLGVQAQGMDERSIYRYEISGKISMKMKGEREGWTYLHMINFMKQFVRILEEINNYLLDIHCLLLEPEYIYYEKEQVYFCYCPALKQNLWEKFHELTEYFVRETDYGDKEAIYFAYELHKASMEENYKMEDILDSILERKESEMNRLKLDTKELSYELEDDQILDEWAGEQKCRNQVVREQAGVWGFVSRKLQKRG